MDGFFTRYGKHTILVCRLLPFVPFDPISYAAGLTSIRFRRFLSPPGLVSYRRLLFIPGRAAC
ncbi:snare associated golgi protein [Escherichia coli O157:H7 str. TW14588]|nr:snare associated golgi protein [Escherichia coli O157:H7 str. TW14588]